MRFSDMIGIERQSKRLLSKRARLYTLGIIITGILSILLSVVTFYGQNTGNFVMTVDPDAGNRGIHLSTDPNFSFYSSRLMSNPVMDARDITYTWIKFDEIAATDGQFTDPDYRYVAYSFYIRNSGRETVDVNYYIRITDVHLNLDAAVRFLVIEDKDIHRMYQKPDQPLPDGSMPRYYEMPEAIPFLTNRLVFRETLINFKPGDVTRFSVIIWLEGQDPDTNDSILGGMLRAHMNFSILQDN